MNLKQLECFIAVAQSLSFTKAAEDLGMTQPPLSRHIRRLEQDLGAELFNRDKRRVELTDVGRAFLPRVRELVRQAQVARSEVTEMIGLGPAKLRVGGSGMLAAFVLPDIVASFRAIYSDVTLRLVQRRSEELLDAVEQDELDIAIVRLPLRETDLDKTRLGSEQLFAALPPDHPLSGEESIPVSALRNEQFIMCSGAGEPFYAIVSDMCVDAGFLPNVICDGAEYTTVFRLVGMGLGVTVTSEVSTRLAVDPSPVFIPIEGTEKALGTVMLTKHKSSRSPAAEAFHALVLKSQQNRAFEFPWI